MGAKPQKDHLRVTGQPAPGLLAPNLPLTLKQLTGRVAWDVESQLAELRDDAKSL